MSIYCIKSSNKNIRRIISHLLIASLFFSLILPSAHALESKSCIQTKITTSTNLTVEVPFSPGNTNNDPSFEETNNFSNIIISDSNNILGICTHKSSSARLLNIDPSSGVLTLSNSLVEADPVNSNDPGATRGICIFSPSGNQIFFAGNGPKEAGFDRIYAYNVNNIQKFNENYFFIPNELPTSLTITPNNKYLLYLQSLTNNNNLASIQAIGIRNGNSLEQNFVGQDIAKIVEAGTNFEIVGNAESEIIYGVFSNARQDKNASGDGFGLFQTNQETGSTTILGEYKKNNPDFHLPPLFNNPLFVGFSSLKLIEVGSNIYLIVSYVENSSKEFSDFKYNTKLAIFKVFPRENSVELVLAGKPISTVTQLAPCNEKKLFGISGPIQLSEKTIYIGDSNPEQENYLASFYIDWDEVISGTEESNILTLSSTPIKVPKEANERITDIALRKDNKFIYVVLSNLKSTPTTKISSFSLEHSNLTCSTIATQIGASGICKVAPEKNYIEISKKPENVKNTQPTPEPIDEIILTLDNNTSTSSVFTTPSIINSPSLSFLPTIISSDKGRPPLAAPTKGRPPLFGSSLAIKPSAIPILSHQFPTSGTKPGTLNVPSNTKQPTLQLQPAQPVLQESTLPHLPEIAPLPKEAQVEKVLNQTDKTTKNDEKLLTDEDLDLILIEAEEGEKNDGGDLEIEDLDITLLATETSTINLSSQEIDIKILDLSGKDMPIYAPRIPWISLSTEKLEEAKIETIKKEEADINLKITPKAKIEIKKENKKTEIIQSAETNGAINIGSGGYIITLKDGININKKDLKKIIFAVIENNKVIEIDAKPTLISTNKLLAELTFPNDIKLGSSSLVALLNKGKDKKVVISKGKVDIFGSTDFENIGIKNFKINSAPTITNIERRTTGTSKKGGKIIRLKFHGSNFASKLIKIGTRAFISKKSHTFISFGDNSSIEIIKMKVASNGNKMLVTIRSQREDISSTIPITISTPKGQYFKDKIGVKFNNPIKPVLKER